MVIRQADERKHAPFVTPATETVAAFAGVEIGNQMSPTIQDPQIAGANDCVSKNLLEPTTASSMKLAKAVFGKVAAFGLVFNGLKRIMGGI